MTSSRKNDGDGIAIVLFRHDLRIADNRALAAASASFGKVVPVFVFDEESPGTRPLGGARRWWLHASLERLAASLVGVAVEPAAGLDRDLLVDGLMGGLGVPTAARLNPGISAAPIDRYFGVFGQTVTPAEFFDPANLQAILYGAATPA